MDVYYLIFFRIVRTCCVSLKLTYFSLLVSKNQLLASGSAHVCTIDIGFELSWSSCQIFDGTVKFVAQIFDGKGLGMVPYLFFGVVHEWNCLIGSLVVQCSQRT